MLGFHNDAIILSGETGTKLKSEILGKYYRKWWEIASGGKYKNFSLPTTIIEMNSATGEVYVKDTDETLLGSSGHALDLKANNLNTQNLGVVLVEENNDCFTSLQNIINRNWPKLSYSIFSSGIEDENFLTQNPSHVDEIVSTYRLGNSLFFFDPLLSVSWDQVEYIAKKRIKKYYQAGTEFLIFLFTSDFFLGRNEFGALPENNDETTWSEEECRTVKKINELLGNTTWNTTILNSKPIKERMELLTLLYKKKLQKWFRYVLPLPFIPKKSQLYTIFFCSNFELGVKLTKDFYAEFTNNRGIPLDSNNKTYEKFIIVHPEKRTTDKTRSSEWKILWRIIKSHEDGLCDKKCKDFLVFGDEEHSQEKLEWLESQGYLKEIQHLSDAWEDPPKLYKLDWNFVEETLMIEKPPELSPLSSDAKIKKPKKQGLDEFL